MQQFIHAPEQAQLPLFEAFLAQPVLPGLKARNRRARAASPSCSANCRCAAPLATAKACWPPCCAN